MALTAETELRFTKSEVQPWMTDADLFDWEIWSWTTVRQPPAGFETQAPYTVALVKGVKVRGDYQGREVMVTAQLTDLGDEPVDFGMRVEPVVRLYRADGERGVLDHHIKFRPPIRKGGTL